MAILIRGYRMLNTRRIVIALAALVALCAAVVSVSALADGAYVSAADGAGALVAADESPDLPQQRRGEAELPWLFAVYAITWAAFFGYVFVMSRRQREMRAEIAALKRALAERE